MDINQIKNLIRIGTVSAVNGETWRAPGGVWGKEKMVGAGLTIITISRRQTETHLLPEGCAQGLCVF